MFKNRNRKRILAEITREIHYLECKAWFKEYSRKKRIVKDIKKRLSIMAAFEKIKSFLSRHLNSAITNFQIGGK